MAAQNIVFFLQPIVTWYLNQQISTPHHQKRNEGLNLSHLYLYLKIMLVVL